MMQFFDAILVIVRFYLELVFPLLDVCVVYSTHLELSLNSIFQIIHMIYPVIDPTGETWILYPLSSWHYIVSEEVKSVVENIIFHCLFDLNPLIPSGNKKATHT